MSVRTYQTAQRNTESPRNTEYRLFAQVTRALMQTQDVRDPRLHDALNWNRRLWLTLQMDLLQPDNRMPDDLKARLISVSIWVEKHTRKAARGEAAIQPLIDLNRQIMEGLAPQPLAGAGAAPASSAALVAGSR